MPEEPEIDTVIKEFEEVRDELKDILMDIRVFLMEALTPIPNDLERARLREELEADRR
jgi:predicted RNase H-like HicB family nuclease